MMIRRLCKHVRHNALSSKFQSVRVKRESLAASLAPDRHGKCLSTVAPLGQEEVLTRELRSKYDAIVIGAGHNGLIAASYLQKAGYDVCVLEKRYVIGGAAVTEEIVPGFKFSRASYLLSLLRPHIFQDLKLKEHGLKVHLRQPDSYTPLHESYWKNSSGRSLTLGRDPELNHQQISQFSKKDAESYKKYEAWLGHLVSAIDPLLNTGPVNSAAWLGGSLKNKAQNYTAMKALVQTGRSLGKEAASFYELMTAPASKVLDRWFESEPLKATLATDSVIGAMASPKMPGSGYVLLHHVFGELEGIKGAWGYVEGGMGGVSLAIARFAHAHGASIFVDKSVSEIVTNSQGKATGVVLEDGTEIQSKMVLSCATPKITFLNLVPKGVLPEEFVKDISLIDYTSPVTKINVAVNKLPNFTATPNPTDGSYLPHHQCTIHLNCEDSEIISEGYMDATQGNYSRRPMIEMTIPSTLDRTIAPPGCHVVLLFTQYTPFTLADGKEWDEATKDEYADLVFDTIEQYAPGFKESVVGRDILTPPDLEELIGLTGGNIFHGSMSLDQLYLSRPVPSYCDYRSPIPGLYLCGSGAHPGGGVMGEPGHQAAMAAIQDF